MLKTDPHATTCNSDRPSVPVTVLFHMLSLKWTIANENIKLRELQD